MRCPEVVDAPTVVHEEVAQPVSAVPLSVAETEVPRALAEAPPTVGLVEVVSVLGVMFLEARSPTGVLAESLVAQRSLVPSQCFEARLVVRWQSVVPLGSGQVSKVQLEVPPTSVAGNVAKVEVVGCTWP